MSTEVTKEISRGQKLEQVLIKGNLAVLTDEEKVIHYNRVCESLGLNPLTQPFGYINFKGKEILYPLKNCAEQLRDKDKISIEIVSRELKEDIYIITARATNTHGRFDESTAALCISGLKGEDKANAFMKCETKAKRRVTLSICGLGMLDESEIEDVNKADEKKANMKQSSQGLEAKLGIEDENTIDMPSQLESVKKLVQDAKNRDEFKRAWEYTKSLSAEEKESLRSLYEEKMNGFAQREEN